MIDIPTTQAAPEPISDPARRARQRRLLEIRGAQPEATDPGGSHSAASPPSEGRDLNAFISTLVDRREQRRHQIEIIQDFFENPVEFGIEADVIPSGTPLEEIRERKKELRYRIDLLRSVLEALEGEHKLLTHAEMSALRPQSDPVE